MQERLAGTIEFGQKYGVSNKRALELCDMIITAVRADRIIGRSSCSVVEECWTDLEMLEFCCCHPCGDEQPAKGVAKKVFPTPRKAVSLMRDVNAWFYEREVETLSYAF